MSERHDPRPRGQQGRTRRPTRYGFSHFELIFSVVVIGVGVLGLATAGTDVFSEPAPESTVEFWAALQTVGDSLQANGYGSVSAGSRTVGRYHFDWTVDRSVTNLDRVTLAGSSLESDALADTVLIYLAGPNTR